MIGVVLMNYHGYLILAGGQVGESFVNRVFDPWNGPLSTRFAATFVLVAGMGVTLMTNRSRLGDDPAAVRHDRWTLVRRGVALYAFGYVLDWIWPGTILFYYGALFVVGAALFTLRTRWLAAIGAGAAIVAAAIQWWVFERRADGHRVDWLLNPSGRSPRGLLFDTLVNGTHPLLPWLAFFCAGIILGRHLKLPFTWLPLIILGGLGVTMLTYAAHGSLATTPLRRVLFATDPFSRSLVYTIGTLGSSIAAFAAISLISELSKRTRVTQGLAAAGRMTLTIYVLHALVFNAVVHDLGWVRPTGLDTAWLLTIAFWVPAIVSAAWWQRRFGLGPLERLYRRFGGDEYAGRPGNPLEPDLVPSPQR
ncbi:MAG: DUF418 domain-containing protein [Ilumatobacteraceae bacterium]